MRGRRVTSWTLRVASGETLPQVFVGDLVEAEGWAHLVTGDAPYRLLGADGQRSEVLRVGDSTAVPTQRRGA